MTVIQAHHAFVKAMDLRCPRCEPATAPEEPPVGEPAAHQLPSWSVALVKLTGRLGACRTFDDLDAAFDEGNAMLERGELTFPQWHRAAYEVMAEVLRQNAYWPPPDADAN